ncbi:PAS domain S-box protein [uncultured Nostoc sp.]|uniref:PAS domain S-box protein n=1 Tax=uncultured Nostoc sp. TaxID=340711 RepID=UPI0035CC1A42
MLNFQTLFESIPGLYIVYSLDFVIVAGNDAYFRATKTKREQVVGRPFFEVFPDNPDDPNANGVQNLRASLSNVIKDRLPHTMAVQKYDIRRPQSEGGGFEERYWMVTNSPVFGENGEMTHIIHRAEDVTELVRVQQQRDEQRHLNQSLQTRSEQMEMEIYARAQELRQVNEQLQVSEQQLQLILKTSKLGSWQFDLKTNVLSTSDQCKVNYGLPIEADFSHQVLMERIHPEDRTWVKAAIQDSITNRTDYNVEYRTVWNDRSTHWVLVRGCIIDDEAGNPERMVGISLDITDRKIAEADLREAYVQWESALAAGAIYTWRWKIPDNLVIVNAAFAHLFGVDSAKATTGLPIELFIQAMHEEDRPQVVAAINQAIETGEEYVSEYRIYTAVGEERWVAARGRVEYAADGKAIAFPGALADITERKQAESAWRQISAELERQLRKFDAIASSVTDFIYTFDLSGRFTYINQPLLDLLQKKSAQALGKNFFDLDYPTDLATRLQNQIQQVIETRQPLRDETPYTSAFGTRAYEYIFVPLLDINGAVEAVAGVTRDITDRKQSEQALQEQTKLMQVILDSIGDGLILANPQGEFVLFNQAAERIFGRLSNERSCDEWSRTYGLFLSDRQTLFPDEQLPLYRAMQGEYANDVEVFVRRAAAFEGRWVSISGFPVMDMSRKVTGGVITCRDITDRKQIEATVKASNERLTLLSQVANDLLLNEDPKAFLASLFEKVSTHLGLEVYFNYLFEEDQQRLQLHTSGGISEDIALSAQFLELGQGVGGYVVQHRLPAIIENALSTTDPLAVRVQSIGIRAYVCHPLIVGDRVLGTLGLGTRQRDRFTPDELDLMQTIANQVAAALERSRLVAELQARAEALDQSNRIKDEFLAVLSHELRTPLNPILGWSKLLQQKKLDATKTTTALATIERNAQLQVQLIDDLLDISRILSGKMSLSTSPIDLNAVICAALETVRLAAEAKLIQIQTTVLPILGVVVGDAGRLQQVVWNLLSNAVKFTPFGGQVTIALSQAENHAQIQITDTGKGIRADFLPYVFEHFRQEDGATTRKFGGLGLGLAIVRQIVEMHGGTVTVDSPGVELGATFTVQIPLAPQLTEAPTLKQSPVKESDLSGIHILVVDDETDSREFIAFVLEQHGAIVTAVASGADALQAFTQSIPNIIISDIGMPEMDGYMLIRQIRALPPQQGGQIPAIALTAYAGELDQQQAIATGFQRHVAKPIDPEVLVAIVVQM